MSQIGNFLTETTIGSLQKNLKPERRETAMTLHFGPGVSLWIWDTTPVLCSVNMEDLTQDTHGSNSSKMESAS